jgi:hypothetical protein
VAARFFHMRPEGIEPSTYLCCARYARPEKSLFSLCNTSNFSGSRAEQAGVIRLEGATKVQHDPRSSARARGTDISVRTGDGTPLIGRLRVSTHGMPTSVGDFV